MSIKGLTTILGYATEESLMFILIAPKDFKASEMSWIENELAQRRPEKPLQIPSQLNSVLHD